MAKYLTLFFISAFLSIPSQNITYSLQLYYNINESSSPENLARLDSFCKTLPASPARISITGYADFLHSDTYNQELSQKRADQVKDHLMQIPVSGGFTIVQCKGRGEALSRDNGSKEGEQTQRRVDLVVEMSQPAKVPLVETKKEQATILPEQKTTTDVPLEELKEGESIALEGLSFEPGRHTPLKSSWPVLKKLLKTLQDHPTIRIEIQGHICCAPGIADSYDYDSKDGRLSQNRAKVVYDYLVRNGISADRLTYKGYGHSRPKVKETSPEQEQINRRVEVRILEN